jgi:hypothetical protein
METTSSGITLLPQENYNPDYIFKGEVILTAGAVTKLLELHIDAMELINILRKKAEAEGGIDYLQRFRLPDGELIWIIDQLSKAMLASGKYDTEENICTILLPSEY